MWVCMCMHMCVLVYVGVNVCVAELTCVCETLVCIYLNMYEYETVCNNNKIRLVIYLRIF